MQTVAANDISKSVWVIEEQLPSVHFSLKTRRALLHLLVVLILPCLVWAQKGYKYPYKYANSYQYQHQDSLSLPSSLGANDNHCRFDINLLDKINPDTPASQYQKQISNSAYWLPAAVVVGELGYGLINNDALNKRYAVETTVTVGIGQAISIGLKQLFNRPRPFMTFPDRIHPINYGTGPSFPSGHTTLAFSTATSLALTRKQWTVTVPITLWAGSVGYSRMYLGRHYPTDVLGGIATGIVSGILGHWLTGRIYGD